MLPYDQASHIASAEEALFTAFSWWSALKHKKKCELNHSSSSLWDLSPNSGLLCPPEMNVSTYTLSFNGSIYRVDETIGISAPDQHSTFHKSFARRFLTGIKRSLSLHHIHHTSSRGDPPRQLSVEQLNQTDTVRRVLVQRRGSRTARLLQCVRPSVTGDHQASTVDRLKPGPRQIPIDQMHQLRSHLVLHTCFLDPQKFMAPQQIRKLRGLYVVIQPPFRTPSMSVHAIPPMIA
ncbi:unnamed protein product [Echinostoma caproni]|uniref:Uncharacterized protein n=1 Tax=Echinostoma caproni TaxID=27848 RepID=A0A183A719_9TREM|nr:unnamed protein product [Echinostoma caproni]